jgi:hypothetical protein
MWSWVETTGSSANCRFKGWYSAKAGGAALPGNCSGRETGYTGGSLQWSASKTPPIWKPCALKSGGVYYFNLQMTRADPGPYHCESYLQQN